MFCFYPKWHFIPVFLLVIILFNACTSSKKIIYLQDIPVSKTETLDTTADYFIRPNDLLDITVSSQSAEMDGMINAISKPANSPNNIAGFLVDKEGFINLPFVGLQKVAGLHSDTAKMVITGALKAFLKDPVVNLRLANFKISILGEVARPGTFIIPNERISVLQAVSLAGDLTIYARRSNVLIIREQDGIRHSERIDLTKSNFFHSPFYYLQPNDVVYVEPLKSKVAQNDTKTWQILTFAATILSLVTIVMTRANF